MYKPGDRIKGYHRTGTIVCCGVNEYGYKVAYVHYDDGERHWLNEEHLSIIRDAPAIPSTSFTLEEITSFSQ